ncbi:MAG: DUF1905 domain-containing protein [Hyphomicrobiales bacterium]|nr:MAG: DUF1905 domain-containing protein [Hyphomicrobiales bacterium]
MLRFAFRSTIIHWRGPAPFFYAPVPEAETAGIRAAAKRVSYGWGVIPVEATIGGVTFTTSLFPKDGIYLLPLKAAVRTKLAVTVGDTVDVAMTLGPAR